MPWTSGSRELPSSLPTGSRPPSRNLWRRRLTRRSKTFLELKAGAGWKCLLWQSGDSNWQSLKPLEGQAVGEGGWPPRIRLWSAGVRLGWDLRRRIGLLSRCALLPHSSAMSVRTLFLFLGACILCLLVCAAREPRFMEGSSHTKIAPFTRVCVPVHSYAGVGGVLVFLCVHESCLFVSVRLTG